MWLKLLLIPERCHPPWAILKQTYKQKLKMVPSAFIYDFIPSIADIDRPMDDCIFVNSHL